MTKAERRLRKIARCELYGEDYLAALEVLELLAKLRADNKRLRRRIVELRGKESRGTK